MSVSFANAVADGLRHNGVVVHYWTGWDRRGNGQTSAYQGLSWHHTATGYGSAPAILVNGRPDLSGPLCNTSGNADGSITIIAAHPANHAGASGGRSMGPLPTTRSFNRLMWGHEIVYPGTQPMTAAQYRSACILAGVVCGILKRPNPEWARGHAETSVTGKWDPGYAPGKTVDLRKMRADIWPALHSTPTAPPPEVPDVDANQDRMLREVHRELTQRLGRRIEGSKYNDTVMGYAMNADSFGYRGTEALARIEKSLSSITARLDALDGGNPPR